MHIEFLGIPGSGKTYQATQYKKKLIKDGILFLDVSRHKAMPFWLKVFYKITETFFLYLPKYKKQVKEYGNICDRCLSQPKYLPFSLAYCVKDIVLASVLHDVFRGKRRVIINDEGALQRIVFLCVQYDAPLDDLLTIYNKYRLGVKTLYVDTDVDTAYKNIRRRNRHVCPMDEMSIDNLKAYLQECLYVCERINEALSISCSPNTILYKQI